MRRDHVIVVVSLAVLGLVIGIARGWTALAGISIAVLIGVFVVTAPMGASSRRRRRDDE